MAKIEQDNRVLAELDKSRATIGSFLCVSMSSLSPSSRFLFGGERLACLGLPQLINNFFLSFTRAVR